jgi:hypothetical protein
MGDQTQSFLDLLNYVKLYDEWIDLDCQHYVFEDMPHVHPSYILFIKDKVYYYETYQDHEEDTDRQKFTPQIIVNKIQQQQPFTVFVHFEPYIHYNMLIYRPQFGLEHIEPMPRPNDIMEYNHQPTVMIENHWNQAIYIEQVLTAVADHLNIPYQTPIAFYDQFDLDECTPPQLLENNTIAHLSDTNPQDLRGWDGGSCIFWCTMITKQLFQRGISFHDWFTEFCRKYGTQESKQLIDDILHRLFQSILQCQQQRIKG